MLFSRLEEMFDEVNPTKPFVWRCFERDAIVGRKESAGCVSTSTPPLLCLCLYALGTSKTPSQDAEVESDDHMGSNYSKLKAQNCSNGEEKISWLNDRTNNDQIVSNTEGNLLTNYRQGLWAETTRHRYTHGYHTRAHSHSSQSCYTWKDAFMFILCVDIWLKSQSGALVEKCVSFVDQNNYLPL